MQQKQKLKQSDHIAKVTFVGAGPGDPDLITVRGARALSAADAVLYDALVDDELLALAPDAVKVFVGKRAGNHALTQDAINRTLVEMALEHGHIVRLKGGDPYVFGRGHEEKQFVESYGIEVEVIPGVSSAIAVPGVADIPLTKRGTAESFWVITATTAKNRLSADVALAARSSATVVILMGVRKLREIVKTFSAVGKGDTPVAVIQNGTTHDQQIVVNTIDGIVGEVDKEKIGSPAIIVIGEVVREGREKILEIATQKEGEH